MPASSFDMFYVPDARNNFEAMRPAPICIDGGQTVGRTNKIHISTNCYYGYHDSNSTLRNNDCEMMESMNNTSNANNLRKRSACDEDFPPIKRHRQGMLFILFLGNKLKF